MRFIVDHSVLKRNHKFRSLFAARTISLIGTMITNVALPYQIYHITTSTLMVGLLSLAQLIPLLFTALYGGALADQHNRRNIIIIAEIVLSSGSLLLFWNALNGHNYIWLLFIIAAFMSAIVGLHRPAFDSLKQQILEKKDFAAAGALQNLMRNTTLVLGPAIGGMIIAHFNLPITYLVDFFSFAISLILIFIIGHIPVPSKNIKQPILSALTEGLRYSMSRQDLLGSYLVDFVAMIFGMPQALFPAIAMQHGGASTLGLLYAAPAFGAVMISIFSGWMFKIKRHCAAIAIAASLWGVAIIFFGIVNNFWLMLFFLALAGLFDGISGIFRDILWNETIPHELRGRLAGIEMISYLSGPKLGDTEAGIVASLFGITASIISGGVLCIVGVAACCYYLPKFWSYRSS